MKILENPYPEKSKVHVCEKCQCKFEFTERDVKVDVCRDAKGRICATHYCSLQSSVACPNCGEPYILRRVGDELKERIKERDAQQKIDFDDVDPNHLVHEHIDPPTFEEAQGEKKKED